jgi:channel protein (hemolysin III family)
MKIGFAGVIGDLSTWPVIGYSMTVVFCLGSSTLFHWFYPKSCKVKKVLHRLDLASISVLIWGSCMAVTVYVFYCDKFWLWFYSMIMSILCGIVFTISMQDWIYHPSTKAFRGYMYIALGITSAAPIIHGCLTS